MAPGGSTLHGVTDDQKRWLVFGIVLSKVLVPEIRPFIEQEVQNEYGNLQTSHSIQTQSTSGRLKNWPTSLKYENINGNYARPRLPGGRFNYSLFDCRVTSHVDFARLYVENHMAKFNAFDEHCDASAVLTLLGKVPVFSPAVQSASNDVRQARNAWAHCVFSDWDPVNYQQSFNNMETLVQALGLPPADEGNLLGELKDWELKGCKLCMNATMDPDLLKLVQRHVHTLKTDVEQLTFDVQEDKERVSQALKDISTSLEDLKARIESVEREQEVMKQEQSLLSDKMESLCSDVEDAQQRVALVEDKLSSSTLQESRGNSSYGESANVIPQQDFSNVSIEIASCEGDITFFAKRYDSETRRWFFDEFDKWFRDPGDSRAFVLLADPGVGKSVMAGVMAQRMTKAGHLGAAYFCCHNDGTRNNPRYLLGTVARQLCNCDEYKEIIGGENGVKMLLANSKLGVRELFRKLLQEPLSKCSPCDQRKLVIIDALDETEYESREGFLDLMMDRFPLLPEWLVFFITSRPESSVQFTLKMYNRCVQICAGNCDQNNFYQKHEKDIQTFLKNKIDFSRLSLTVEDISKKCNGLFLYAHYIVEKLKLVADSGKELAQFSDLCFPGDIDSFFLQNFKRVHDQVGQDIFKKLFGCIIVAPAARLPVSIISYILEKENSSINEQEVIDAVSLFLVLRTSDQTLTFLHSLIPAWLTDKNKASRKLFIDKRIAGEYLIKVFVDILQQAHPPADPSIDVDLKDYVSRVAVRFLCENGAEDSLKFAFNFLTNYHFIERRMKYGKIEIYHLLEDFRLAANRFALEEVSKQEILQKILFAIESNVLVLLECPHLLRSCIRNASNVVQEAVSIPQVSNPRLEWISNYVFPFAVDANITSMRCFATAPNGRVVAGALGRSLQFFDASTVERVSGPFELANDVIGGITHLEFTPDGKFLFFGRLDKWFSVERGCVEDFPQFSGNFSMYKWGVFTRDGQCIVVKTSFSSDPRTCRNQFCLSNFLALWALKEIQQSGDDEMTVSFCPDACNQVEPCKRLFEPLRMRGMLAAGLGGGLKGYVSRPQSYSCLYCRKLQELSWRKQEPSLENVRKLVIEFYPCIFHYQVWDRQSGLPLLEQVFLQNCQLNPFTYLCHCVYSEAGMKFSGIEKAMSLCNIAIVTAVCRFLLECKSYLEEERKFLERLQELLGSSWHQSMYWRCTEEYRKSYLNQLIEEYLESYLHQPMEEQRKPYLHQLMEEHLRSNLHQLMEDYWESGIKQSTKLQGFVSPELFRGVRDDAFKIKLWRNIPDGFQKLLDCVNGEILTCMSPKMKWVIQADGKLQVSKLQTGNQEEHHIHIEKPVRFSCSKDDLFLLHQSSEGSLHALSFKTGKVLSSVSGCKVGYFTRERQIGYLFRCGTEETAIFLTSLFSPFKFLRASNVAPSFVGKSMAAMFRSTNAVVSVSSDSMVTVMHNSTFGDKEVITKDCIGCLSASSSQSLTVKSCALFSDGRLIAIHRESKIELYSFTESKLKFLYSKCESTVTCFAFSSDSTALLLCTQDSGNDSYFHVWDIQGEVVSACLESRGNLIPECCCLSSDKVVLCGDYEIEIWEYAKHTCCFFTRFKVQKPYNLVRFSQCTLSVDNQFLVCCIADAILVYSLRTSNIDSSKQVFHGHLGRIEFFRLLKINRYLISYGIDGMVFLWDISQSKAVGFTRIVKGQESIVSMAVSPEEDRAVFFTSTGRVCMIKLCELGSALE